MDPPTSSDSNPISSRLQLARPLPAVRLMADDWTGITNARERKRRQNRLNQRLYRQYRACYRGDCIAQNPVLTMFRFKQG